MKHCYKYKLNIWFQLIFDVKRILLMKHRMAFLRVSFAAFIAEVNVGMLTALNDCFKSTAIKMDKKNI